MSLLYKHIAHRNIASDMGTAHMGTVTLADVLCTKVLLGCQAFIVTRAGCQQTIVGNIFYKIVTIGLTSFRPPYCCVINY